MWTFREIASAVPTWNYESVSGLLTNRKRLKIHISERLRDLCSGFDEALNLEINGAAEKFHLKGKIYRWL